MSKDNLKITQNQHRNCNSLDPRRLKPSAKATAWAQETTVPMNKLVQEVENSKETELAVLHGIVDLFWEMGNEDKPIFFSKPTLAREFNCTVRTIGRCLKKLKKLNFFYNDRYWNASNSYWVHPQLKESESWFMLRGVLLGLQALSISLLFATCGYGAESDINSLKNFALNSSLQTVYRRRVPLEKEQGYYFNNISGSVESAEQSEGVPRTKGSRLAGRGVTETYECEILEGSLGEKVAWSLPNVPIDPRDMQRHAHFVATATHGLTTVPTTNTLKRSGEYEFVPEPVPIKATSESFDNNPNIYLGVSKMPEQEPPFDEEYEEEELAPGQLEQIFEDVHVGGPFDAKPMPTVPISLPREDEKELLSLLKIKLPSQTPPVVKSEKPEGWTATPTKPWNAPPERKVFFPEHVESLFEFQQRVFEDEERKREKNERRSQQSSRKHT